MLGGELGEVLAQLLEVELVELVPAGALDEAADQRPVRAKMIVLPRRSPRSTLMPCCIRCRVRSAVASLGRYGDRYNIARSSSESFHRFAACSRP